MNEYISREAMLRNLTADLEHHSDEGDPRTNLIMQRFIEYVENFPSTDVQPVDRWISVKERFPDEDGWYLVCKHNRVRVAEWCKDCWYNESDLPIDDCTITYWKPLPEPPKDGDTNG